MTAARFAKIARDHLVLDVTMNEDRARNRKDNGPENLGILRHVAINLLSKERTSISQRRKLNKAEWNNDFLMKLIAQI